MMYSVSSCCHNNPGSPSITRDQHAWDTEAGAQNKRCKHWGVQGASEFDTASSAIETRFVRYAEELNYQLWLATLLVSLWHDKVVLVVPHTVSACLGEHWSQRWRSGKCGFGSPKHHFKTGLHMLPNQPVG